MSKKALGDDLRFPISIECVSLELCLQTCVLRNDITPCSWFRVVASSIRLSNVDRIAVENTWKRLSVKDKSIDANMSNPLALTTSSLPGCINLVADRL